MQPLETIPAAADEPLCVTDNALYAKVVELFKILFYLKLITLATVAVQWRKKQKKWLTSEFETRFKTEVRLFLRLREFPYIRI